MSRSTLNKKSPVIRVVAVTATLVVLLGFVANPAAAQKGKGGGGGDETITNPAFVFASSGDDGLRLGLFVHHTDAVREYAYDRDSVVGRLDRALDMAAANGWIVVSMKDDWRRIFPPLK